MSFRLSAAILVVAIGAAACASGIQLQPYELPRAGLAMEHPEGWLAQTDGRTTLFAETQAAMNEAYLTSPPPATARTIVFDHRDLEFMEGIGLSTDAGDLEGLHAFNAAVFGWEVLEGPIPTRFLGHDALAVRVATPVGVSDVIEGFLPERDEVFYFEFSAPDAASLDDSEATWEAVVASVEWSPVPQE